MEAGNTITPEELGAKLAVAIGVCADKAAEKATGNNQNLALAYAETAEKLSTALAVVASMKQQ